MKTLQEIKDEVAQEHTYTDYREFYELTRKVDTNTQMFIMDAIVNKVSKAYALEAIKADRERVAKDAYFIITDVHDKLVSKGQRGWLDDNGNHCEINKESILNLPIELK